MTGNGHAPDVVTVRDGRLVAEGDGIRLSIDAGYRPLYIVWAKGGDATLPVIITDCGFVSREMLPVVLATALQRVLSGDIE